MSCACCDKSCEFTCEAALLYPKKRYIICIHHLGYHTFLPLLFTIMLEALKKCSVICIQLRVEHSSVSSLMYISQLWVFMIIRIHCIWKVIRLELRDALNNKSLICVLAIYLFNQFVFVFFHCGL